MTSVLILTKNEAADLPGCLASVAWSDDVHILDSESTDNTREIAEAHGAIVTVRRFDGYATQRNAGLALPFKHPWVLVLDADERPTPELSAEIQRVTAEPPTNVAAFQLRRKDFLWGQWLKHAQMTPFYLRLFRVGQVQYTREVNEVAEVIGSGEIRDLAAPLDHFPFSKGLSHWVAKHNVYSTREAQLLASGAASAKASLRDALFAKEFSDRRVAQKAIFYRMPFRPGIKWLYMMFVRGAVLDGSAGFTYATLQAIYEYMISLKTRELLQSKQS